MKCYLGFTLIEVLLALAISAILIGLGYPSYVSYQVDAQRDRAEIALMQLSAGLESYFDHEGSYEDATLNALGAKDLTVGLHYRLKINTATDRHFKIAAIPTGIQLSRDTICGVLALTDTNKKMISGTGSMQDCWKT